jgi:hypothetical protein
MLGGAVAIAFAAPLILHASGLHPPLWLRLTIAAAVIVPGFWAVCQYWRSIDEAAREAQKWAWYWGGSVGMAAGVLAFAVAIAFAPGLAALAPADLTTVQAMAYGGFAMAAAQMVGFVVAWAYWWAVRR